MTFVDINIKASIFIAMKKQTPSVGRDSDKFMLRFPDGMRDRIKRDSEEQGRSMNAQIIHMLQSHYDEFDASVEQLVEASALGNVSALYSPDRSTALIKVLLAEELLLLQKRITRLGGNEAVLSTPKSELIEKINDDGLTGTEHERSSYFSQMVGNTPITALLTTDELNLLAERLALIQGGKTKS